MANPHIVLMSAAYSNRIGRSLIMPEDFVRIQGAFKSPPHRSGRLNGMLMVEGLPV